MAVVAPQSRNTLLHEQRSAKRRSGMIAKQSKPARARRAGEDSLVAGEAQSIFQQKFFFFHAVQFVLVHRQYAEFRITHLAVELLVVLIKAAKLGIRLHRGVYVIFLLLFEHGTASSCVGNA